MTREEFTARRKALGMTREQMSFALRRAYKTIGHWEQGKSPVPHWVDMQLRAIEDKHAGQGCMFRHADHEKVNNKNGE